MPVAIQCPSCAKRLNVPDNLLGKRVKCPACKEGFVAEETPPAKSKEAIAPGSPKKSARSEAIAPPPKKPPKPPEEELDDDLIEPEDEEETEPVSKSRRRRDDDDDYEEDDRPRKKRGRRDDDDDDDYAPRRRCRQPHRGGLTLTLGIISLVVCCCPLAGWIMGGIVMNMAKKDLAEMSAGRMDDSGHTLTMVGNICAIVAVVLATLNAIAGAILRITNRL